MWVCAVVVSGEACIKLKISYLKLYLFFRATNNNNNNSMIYYWQHETNFKCPLLPKTSVTENHQWCGDFFDATWELRERPYAHAGGVFGYIIYNIPEIPYRPLHPGCLNIEEYCSSSHRCNQSWNKNNAFYVASDCACMYMESVWQLLFIGYHYRASTIYYFSSP